MEDRNKKVAAYTVCGLKSCPYRCGLSVQVRDGVIEKVRPGDFPDPVDRGACSKGLATPKMTYHPDRLRFPVKRAGGRGEGKWQRISWDEALNDIATRLQDIAQKYGSKSIAWSGLAASDLASAGYSRLASLTKGSWIGWMGLGDSAGPCGDLATFGWTMGSMHLDRLDNPKLSIVWGLNPAETDFHRMKRLTEERKDGCKLVVIDPRFTSTASHADEYIPIRPGTDGALALAMIHAIVESGLQDERFIIENTVGPLLVRDDSGRFLRESDLVQGGNEKRFMVMDGNSGQAQPSDIPGVNPQLTGKYLVSGTGCQPAYQLLADMVKEYTPERASEITDVPADIIKRLAVDYATEKPATIHRGWGLQRSFYGDLIWRAISALAAITGNMNPRRPSTFVMNWRPLFMPEGPYNVIPVMLLYDAITKEKPLAIKAIWFAGHNFANQLPNMNRIVNELFNNLELMVVSDLFMTATARYADYVLPVTSFYECMDLHITNARHTYLSLQQKVIEPLHESKSDFQIATGLGQRMGLGEYFTKTEEQCIEEVLASGHPTMKGITVEGLKEGPVAAKPLDRPPEFRTPTGRVEFYVERLKQFGQELPVYIEPIESTRTEAAKSYPLTLLSTHTRHRSHSTLANVPDMLIPDREPKLEINPVDAQPRYISDGDVVSVFNQRGMVKLRAKLSQHIKPGVVNISQGWWPEQYMEGHHNQLTHERINPVQQFVFEPNAALYDVHVEVKKVDE